MRGSGSVLMRSNVEPDCVQPDQLARLNTELELVVALLFLQLYALCNSNQTALRNDIGAQLMASFDCFRIVAGAAKSV